MFYAVTPFRSPKREAFSKAQAKSAAVEAFPERSSSFEELLLPIQNLIGLHDVKAFAEELFAFYTINEWRKRYHLRRDTLMHHMVFHGPPGTGKTTVARLFGDVFYSLGMLSSGRVIEVERADLVGEYIGHTAQKTKMALEKAKGGILFIDEAYSLARGGETDFGREAIDTLVKGMEEYKQDLVVILAGYQEEMEYFLSLNPGLSSRFPVKIEFPPFREEELILIALQMAKEKDYKISEDGVQALRTRIRAQMDAMDFGNGRTVRNLIEKAIRKQAHRIVNENLFDRERLITLKASDFY